MILNVTLCLIFLFVALFYIFQFNYHHSRSATVFLWFIKFYLIEFLFAVYLICSGGNDFAVYMFFASESFLGESWREGSQKSPQLLYRQLGCSLSHVDCGVLINPDLHSTRESLILTSPFDNNIWLQLLKALNLWIDFMVSK